MHALTVGALLCLTEAPSAEKKFMYHTIHPTCTMYAYTHMYVSTYVHVGYIYTQTHLLCQTVCCCFTSTYAQGASKSSPYAL